MEQYLAEMRARQAAEWQARVNRLLEALERHELFGQSVPPWDYDFVELLLKSYDEKILRQELNKMVIWLKADPKRRKKNYRKFVVNWMNRREKPLYIKYERDEE